MLSLSHFGLRNHAFLAMLGMIGQRKASLGGRGKRDAAGELGPLAQLFAGACARADATPLSSQWRYSASAGSEGSGFLLVQYQR